MVLDTLKHMDATSTATPVVYRDHRPPRELIEALRRVRRPLLAGHVTPDADCISSCLGLAVAMRESGVAPQVSLPGGQLAKRLEFLVDYAGRDLLCTAEPGPIDAVIALDTAGIKRLNLSAAAASLNEHLVLNIDHHESNPGFGRVNWIDPRASSTSEMVYHILVGMNLPIGPGVASLLYAGIHGDTAGFSLPNTTADSLHAAAELIRAGADVATIGERLCRSQNRSDFDLLRRVYDHTTVTPDGRIAYSFLTHEDIVGAGCHAEDIDDQVSIPRSLAGIRIALLFSEGEPGVIRINLRGEGGTSVLPLAQHYGGGGHAASAGVRIRNRPMRDVIDEVVAAAARRLDGEGRT